MKWGYPYGGVLLAQAFAAAAATVPTGLWVRSMHAYFIQVGRDDEAVGLHVTDVRDGRNSCWRSVEVVQAGRLLLSAELMFSSDRAGPRHQDTMPDAPPPGELSNVGTDLEPHLADTFCPWDVEAPFDLRYITRPPRLEAHRGDTGEARSAVWLKAAGLADHDRTLATALLIYASDMCMLDPCVRPHGLWFGAGSASGLSLDHSIWFHAPARVDDWILMDQRSPGMREGRGLGLAEMYAADGELLCSVAQLGSVRVPELTLNHAPPIEGNEQLMPTRTLVEKYFDAVNNHKWEQLAEVFGPEVVVQHGSTLSTSGRDRAVKLLKAVVAQFDQHHDRPTRVLVDGNVAAVEIAFTGTLPGGAALSFEAVDIFDTDGESITKVVSWYDTAEVLPRLRD